MLLGCIQAFGQESRKEVCIGFPVGDSTLDTAYGDNATRLSEVVSFLESVKKAEKLLTKILEIVKFIKNCKFYKNYCAGGTL